MLRPRLMAALVGPIHHGACLVSDGLSCAALPSAAELSSARRSGGGVDAVALSQLTNITAISPIFFLTNRRTNWVAASKSHKSKYICFYQTVSGFFLVFFHFRKFLPLKISKIMFILSHSTAVETPQFVTMLLLMLQTLQGCF